MAIVFKKLKLFTWLQTYTHTHTGKQEICYVQDRILQSILILGTADNQNKNTMEAK